MRKNQGFMKALCMSLIVSMLMGFGGCAMLLQNVRQEAEQDAKQDMEESSEAGIQGEKQDTPAVKEEDGQKTAENEVADNSQNSNETTEKQPSKAEEDLLSDAFLEKMDLLAYLVDQYYMNDISVEDMRTGAYKGLMAGLGDPYTCYYTPEEYRDLMESTSGTYYGIGAVVQQNLKTMYITIVKPYVDGPAYNAGMLPGDIIYKVDDVDVTGMDIDKVVTMMKGPEGTIVKVTVVREGVSDPIELTITRGKIEIETIEHEMLANNIGLVTISSFDELTPKQFKEGIEDLKKQGMKGLIIDLRDNGGGLLSSVVEMLDYVLPDGLIVYTEDKYGYREELHGNDKMSLDMPMVVMINGNSASASEIFAAAMQDYQAATLVGTTSFGKGIVQSIWPLSDGSAVKITISRYFTPRGVCIHGTGVTPNVEVELNEELKQKVVISHEEDNQLQSAITVLRSKLQ